MTKQWEKCIKIVQRVIFWTVSVERDALKAEDSKDSHSMNTCNFRSSSEVYGTIVPALVHTTGDITGTYRAVHICQEILNTRFHL